MTDPTALQVPEADRPDGLAEGLAVHVERWAQALGAAPAAARGAADAARRVSLANREGHVCADLQDLAAPGQPLDALRAELLASAVVGTAQAPGACPLVLDDDGRLYLHRHFDDECRLARRLVQAARAPAMPIDDALRAQLAALFADSPARADGGVDWQQVAVALALRQRLVVISGGPGTGKTTTVVNLLACLLAQDPACRIALAAPTGKAAARMGQAIGQRAAALPPALRERLPRQATTLHRLLGVLPDGGFAHHAGRLLPIDALVVDEASMLDLALARRLLDAVPPQARIVLLGDKDQLAAVESGAVFAELGADPGLSEPCRSALAEACALPAAALQTPPPRVAGVLQDRAVWFQRNYRFAADSGIGRLAAQVNAGQATEALAALREGSDPALRWIDDHGPEPAAATQAAIDAGYAPFLQALQQGMADAPALLAAFDRFRVLCALRAGRRGMAAVNDRLDRLARQASGAAPGSAWYLGRPVMVLRNDPLLQLSNGDIGLALPDADGALQVVFTPTDGPPRRVPPMRLPEHQSAYAMTVHKAQGSEFDAVLLLMPERRSPVLTRELLYTGITRARRAVVLAGGAAVLGAAMQSPTRRHSGLLARLRDAAREDPADSSPREG